MRFALTLTALLTAAAAVLAHPHHPSDRTGPGALDAGAKPGVPKIETFVPPEYPDSLRVQGVEGTVIVKVLVGQEGTVTEAEVIKSAHPDLDRCALEAAKKALFKLPADGMAAKACWMALPFAFKLDAEKAAPRK